MAAVVRFPTLGHEDFVVLRRDGAGVVFVDEVDRLTDLVKGLLAILFVGRDKTRHFIFLL